MKTATAFLLFACIGCSKPAPTGVIVLSPSELHDDQKRLQGRTVETTGTVKAVVGDDYCTILADDIFGFRIIDVRFVRPVAVKSGEVVTVQGIVGNRGTEPMVKNAELVTK